jgi:hypothetical protein
MSISMIRATALSAFTDRCQPSPHVAQYNSASNRGRQSAIDGRTTRHGGLWHVAITPGDGRMYLRLGQAARHHAKNQTSRHRARRRRFMLNLIAYNLIRIPKLIAA